MFLRSYRFDILKQGLTRELYACKRRVDWNTNYFDPCIRTLIIRKFQKCWKNETFHLSNSCISSIEVLIPCFRIWLEVFTEKTASSIGKAQTPILGLEFWLSEGSKLLLFNLEVQTVFPSNYRLIFFHPSSQIKVFMLVEEGSLGKFSPFFLSQSKESEKAQKNFADFQAQISPFLQICLLCSNSQIKTSHK